MNIITGGIFYVVILLPGWRNYFIKQMKENHKTDNTVLTIPFVSSNFPPPPSQFGKYRYHSVLLAVYHKSFRGEFELRRTKVWKLLNYKIYTMCTEKFAAFNN
jgi:hypothetical protein